MRIIQLLFLLIFSVCYTQENSVLDRVSALDNNGKIWYNIDGYSVTSQIFNKSFDKKGLRKVYRKHKISSKDIKTKEEKINFNNYFVSKNQNIIGSIYQTNNYYFVENKNKTITVIWFIKNGNIDRDTEIELVNLIIEDNIPQENFVQQEIDTIGFAGRNIEIGNSCYWTFLNTIQCPYMGEMNWSVHKTLIDAKQSVENQFNITKLRKGIKVKSEEIVDVEFEGVSTKSKKVILEFVNLTSVLAKVSGGKSLTVYYIAENIRNKNVSCVMSFWNNDHINPKTKLPPLLEKIIQLK